MGREAYVWHRQEEPSEHSPGSVQMKEADLWLAGVGFMGRQEEARSG